MCCHLCVFHMRVVYHCHACICMREIIVSFSYQVCFALSITVCLHAYTGIEEKMDNIVLQSCSSVIWVSIDGTLQYSEVCLY